MHTAEHVNTLFALKELSEEDLMKKKEGYESIYLHPTTNDCALLAAGCMLQVSGLAVNLKGHAMRVLGSVTN